MVAARPCLIVKTNFHICNRSENALPRLQMVTARLVKLVVPARFPLACAAQDRAGPCMSPVRTVIFPSRLFWRSSSPLLTLPVAKSALRTSTLPLWRVTARACQDTIWSA